MNLPLNQRWWLGSGGLVLAAATVFAADPDAALLPPPAGREVDFARDIRPLLDTACLRCHGPEKPKSRFRLDDRAEALKGGSGGIAIIPGNSAESPLIHYVARLVPEMEMPPDGKGEPLTPEQVGLLRAWIDQGASWDGTRVARMPEWAVTPRVGYLSVSGNENRFQQLTGQVAGWSGGLESFRLSQELDANRRVTVEGRALAGVEDYAVELRYGHRGWGYLEAGVTQYRRFDNDFGGYYAPFVTPTPVLNRELGLDVGKSWIELGLRRPGWPELTVAYEHHYRDGEKALTQWGFLIQDDGAGNFPFANVTPALKTVDEQRHVIRVEAAQTFGGFRFEDDFQAEFYSADNRREAADYFTPGGTTPDFLNRQREDYDHFLAANAFRVERQFRPWLLATAGYLYTGLDGDGRFRSEVGAPGNPFVPTQEWFSQQLLLEQHTHAFSANTQLGPWKDLVLGLGVQGEWQRQDGFGNLTLDGFPTRLDARLRRRTFDETATLRYTGLPHTVLFAEGRLQQEEVGQFEEGLETGGFGLNAFLRDTDAHARTREALAGFQISPFTWGSLTAQLRHRARDTRYEHLLDTDPLVAGLGYPAHVTGRNLDRDEASLKLALRPHRQLRVTLTYQFAAADYETLTRESVDALGGPALPGTWLLAGNQDAHTVSLAATYTPFTRLMLHGLVSYQDSRIEVPATGVPAVAPYRGDVLHLSGSVTWSADDRTELRAGYDFSGADYSRISAADGLPLGLDFAWHRLTAGVSRRLRDNVTASLNYLFHHYDEQTAGGFNDFRAHGVFAAVTIRMP